MENKLPQRLKELRESKNWSKTFFAERVGTKSLSTYANWEYGIRSPDSTSLIKIADIYGVSVDYLLGRTDNPNPAKEEVEFQKAISDQTLKRWYAELPLSEEEDLQKLRIMWDLISKRND